MTGHPNLDAPLMFELADPFTTDEQLADLVRQCWTQRPRVYVITSPGAAASRFAGLAGHLAPCPTSTTDRYIATDAGTVRILSTNQRAQLRGPTGRFIIDAGALDGLDPTIADEIRFACSAASK